MIDISSNRNLSKSRSKQNERERRGVQVKRLQLEILFEVSQQFDRG